MTYVEVLPCQKDFYKIYNGDVWKGPKKRTLAKYYNPKFTWGQEMAILR